MKLGNFIDRNVSELEKEFRSKVYEELSGELKFFRKEIAVCMGRSPNTCRRIEIYPNDGVSRSMPINEEMVIERKIQRGLDDYIDLKNRYVEERINNGDFDEVVEYTCCKIYLSARRERLRFDDYTFLVCMGLI